MIIIYDKRKVQRIEFITNYTRAEPQQEEIYRFRSYICSIIYIFCDSFNRVNICS